MKLKNLKNKGSIEILLVLCCLVGVVVFFCFALGIAGIVSEPSDVYEQQEVDALVEGRYSLTINKEKSEKILKILEKNLKDLQREIKLKEMLLISKEDDIPEVEKDKVKQTLKNLLKEYEKLKKKIIETQEKLAELTTLYDEPGLRVEKEWKLRRLKRNLNNLEQKIREIKNKISRIKNRATPDDNDLGDLEDLIEEKKDQVEKLKKQIEAEKVKSIWGGAQQSENTLFVECKKGSYIFYPEKRSYPVSTLDNRNIFREMSLGYDMIVLLVRPEGYDSFNKANKKITDMGIKYGYEPLDAGASLEFLRK